MKEVTIDLKTVDGIVVDSAVWSETHVSASQSGGGGYVGPQGGHVSAPTVQIHQSITEKSRLFVKPQDGKEFAVTLANWSISFRTGNAIRLVYANGTMVGIKNMDSGEVNVINDQYLSQNYPLRKTVPKPKHKHVASKLVVLSFLLPPLIPLLVIAALQLAPDYSGFLAEWTDRHGDQIVPLLVTVPASVIVISIFTGWMASLARWSGRKSEGLRRLKLRIRELLNAQGQVLPD